MTDRHWDSEAQVWVYPDPETLLTRLRAYAKEWPMCDAGVCTEAADEIEQLRAALTPFARVAEHGISIDYNDADLYQPSAYSVVPRIDAGMLRAAYRVLNRG